MPWWDAMRVAKANRFAGKSDWRLPARDELKSILGNYDDCTNTKPRRAVSAVFSEQIDETWSQSPDALDSAAAYRVDLSSGSDGQADRSANVHVRLVRAGHQSAYSEFNREYVKIAQYVGARRAYLAESREQERGRVQQRTSSVSSRTGSFSYVHGPSCSTSTGQCMYSVTCSEGGSAQVAVNRENSNFKNIMYYNGGVLNDSGQYSVEAALQLACRGR
jgi:hypothetical protein